MDYKMIGEPADAVLSAKGLQPLTAALLECVTPEQVARTIVERGIAVLGAEAGVVAIVTEDGGNLELVQAQGYATAVSANWGRFPLDANLPLSNAVRENKPLFVSTASEWEALYPNLLSDRTRQTKATVDLPLAEGDHSLGGLHFSFGEERGFSDTDRAFLAELGRQCSLALSRAFSRSAAEVALRRQNFLVRASKILAASLDYERTLASLVRLTVPELVDASHVYVVSETDNVIQRIAIAHSRPEMEAVTREIHARFPIETNPNHPTLLAIATGQTQFHPDITDAMVTQSNMDADHRAMVLRLGLRATLTVPLVARMSTVGAITFVMTADSNRRFSSSLVADLEELASRAAVAVDNARLYAEAHREVAERRQTEQALRESELRKDAILAAALDCIITIDDHECVVEWNPAAERTFGYSRDQALGRNLSEMIIPARLRGAHTRGIARYLVTGEGPALFKRIEVPALRADGTEFPAELTALPIVLEGRTLFTAYVRDITERKLAEEALEEATARQRTLLSDVLSSVTEGKLLLLDSPSQLPEQYDAVGDPILLTKSQGLSELRARVQSTVQAAGHSLERQHDIVTAASEAGMNAIVHAGGGQACVFVSPNGIIQVQVVDKGTGITLENLPQATLERGFSTGTSLGHGLKMMLESVDRMYLLTSSAGTTLVLEQGMTKAIPRWLLA